MLRHRSIAAKRYCSTSRKQKQAVGHMRAGSTDRDSWVASKSEGRKSSHYARPGQVPFDERSYKLATLAVGSLQPYSTVQYSTVQCNTVQYSTVQ